MKRHVERRTTKLKVVGIQYAPTPDADERITRAISILLIAATRHADLSEESTKPEEENNLIRDSAGGTNFETMK